MAERYAVASGNWSNVAIWNGGTTLPQTGDTVYANGYTVYINQSITCVSINTGAGTVAVAGGLFQPLAAYTINANVVSGTTDCLYTVYNCTINGNVTSVTGRGILYGGGGLTINGNITATGTGVGILANASGTITIIGNVTGSGSSGGHAIQAQSSSVVNITGNVTGGSNASAYGISIGGTSTVTVTGNATANTGYAVSHAGSVNVTVTGTVIASTSAEGINLTSTGVAIVGAIEFASNGCSPVKGKVFVVSASAATAKVYESGGSSAVLGGASGGIGFNRAMNGGFED